MVLIGDGMADHPLEVLGGRTPLEAADAPAKTKKPAKDAAEA